MHYSHSINAYCSGLGGSDITFSPNDYYSTGGGGYAGWNPILTYQSLSFSGGNASPNINIDSELNCMKNNSANYTYKIAICVDQPISNSSRPIDDNNDVGHTFIQFSKIDNNTGQTTSRSVGFYPNVWAPISLFFNISSVIRDNSQLPYDVSATYFVNSTKFTNAVNSSINWQNSSYSLEDYNCTDAALSVLSNAGINIPLPLSKVGPIPTGGGGFTYLFLHTPARLGQIIRGMSNSSSVTINEGGGIKGSSGSCK
ncbi:hypothetical protein [Emticicia sp. 21SJ11W-3]|uniref:hypothetical protein n=1 Tax=Emticicia sp. 21SJ11W-3 TaxID=2916755 RepID=UPI00209F2179|nr:hypothetical protein [Emticicia sp. 21SJ11W-3]UTA70233.1 hypothetical protein MB380_10500 [Emticicia sp. 21SJ11W-3]